MSSTQDDNPMSSDNEDNGPPPNTDQDSGWSEIDTVRKVRSVIRSGRGIRRLVSLCGTITQLVMENDRRLLASASDGSDDDNEEEEPPEKKEEVQRRRDRDYQSYLELIKLIPSLKDKVNDPDEESVLLYFSRLLDGANDARSDDLGRVKLSVANLLNNRKNGPAEPALDLYTRDGRGLQHDFTGRLLCPIKYDWEDLAVRAKIRDSTDGYSASNDYWLRCLYEDEKGDLEDVEKGFLKSTLLVKTFQMIFTSPSSARGNLDAEPVPESRRKRRKGLSKRPPIATKLRMDGQVTARAIAYAAVQLHYALCDATHWMSHYNGFNYEEFYEFIIDFFEADQTQEGKNISRELYDWWNKQVFPGSAATRAASSISVRQSSLAIRQEQRRARLSRVPS